MKVVKDKLVEEMTNDISIRKSIISTTKITAPVKYECEPSNMLPVLKDIYISTPRFVDPGVSYTFVINRLTNESVTYKLYSATVIYRKDIKINFKKSITFFGKTIELVISNEPNMRKFMNDTKKMLNKKHKINIMFQKRYDNKTTLEYFSFILNTYYIKKGSMIEEITFDDYKSMKNLASHVPKQVYNIVEMPTMIDKFNKKYGKG